MAAKRKRKRNPAWPHASKGMVNVHIWLPEAVKNQAVLISTLEGYSGLGPMLREIIVAGVAERAARLPRSYLRLRPGSYLYKHASKRWTPLLQAAGGERVWVLAVGPRLTKALGGGQSYLCDVTDDTGEGGVEGRSVYVRQIDCF